MAQEKSKLEPLAALRDGGAAQGKKKKKTSSLESESVDGGKKTSNHQADGRRNFNRTEETNLN